MALFLSVLIENSNSPHLDSYFLVTNYDQFTIRLFAFFLDNTFIVHEFRVAINVYIKKLKRFVDDVKHHHFG